MLAIECLHRCHATWRLAHWTWELKGISMLTLEIIECIVARCVLHLEHPYMRAPARYRLYRMPILTAKIL